MNLKILQQLHRHFHKTNVNPKNTTSSQNWLKRQSSDPYVKLAKNYDYRARSAFKLIEMDDKLKFLKEGMVVVECGAAPGAWSQVILERIAPQENKVNLIGIDLLPIAPLVGAHFLTFADFTNEKTQSQIMKLLSNTKADVILSDMSPNISGINDLDSYRSVDLARSVVQFSKVVCKPGSFILVKLFQGGGVGGFEGELRGVYGEVRYLKPKSSRSSSGEVYLYGRGMR